MIADWRAQWSAATFGEVSHDFPFGYVQLNGDGPGEYASNYKASRTILDQNRLDQTMQGLIMSDHTRSSKT